MAIVRVNPNLEAEVTGSLFSHGPMERVLGDVADLIAANARAIARREFYRTGDYTRGIRAEHGLNEQGELVGRVVATDWKSHFAEYGVRDRRGGWRAHHILARAAQQAGFQVLAAGFAGPVAGRTGARALSSRRTSGRALPAGARAAITGR